MGFNQNLKLTNGGFQATFALKRISYHIFNVVCGEIPCTKSHGAAVVFSHFLDLKTNSISYTIILTDLENIKVLNSEKKTIVHKRNSLG